MVSVARAISMRTLSIFSFSSRNSWPPLASMSFSSWAMRCSASVMALPISTFLALRVSISLL